MCRRQCRSGSAGIWSKNCRFSPPGSRPTLTTNQKDNKVSLTEKYVRLVKCKKMYQLLITFTPYGGSSNVTSMYLSPLLAGSRARSCQKKKTKTTYINFDHSCQGTPSYAKVHTCWKKSGLNHSLPS